MSRHRLTGVVLWMILASASGGGTALLAAGPAPDALTDAKRRAAAELMREGRTADAVAMLQEVVRSDPDRYTDHLQLARALEKLNRPAEAAEAYHRAADLIAAGHVDDRAARAEVERRLRVLDARTAKVAAAEEEFLKKLDALEREAVGARDMRALERVFRDRGGVWAAQGRKDRAAAEIQANGEWQGLGMTVEGGVTYRIQAAGTWYVAGVTPCTADGLRDCPIPGGNAGTLLVAVASALDKYQPIGSGGTFTAPASGKLVFICNMPSQAERRRNTGSVYVLVQPG
jgi:hypothetical protein